ncbi:MAG: LptF/LptG family permease [Gemmatimonadota bacterium]
MKIIQRYVLREHAGPFFFALSALTSLMLLNYIAKRFGELVGKGLPWSVIGEFFVLSIPFTVAMTLPMSVLVAVLYAFSRLAAENEITALKASGVSMIRLIIPPLGMGLLLSFVMIGFNDQLLPRANHRLRQLQTDIANKKPTFALREQVINEVMPSRFYMRVNHVDPASNSLREITIYDLSDPMRRRTVYADSGEMALVAGSDLLLTLLHGYSQEVPAQNVERVQRVFFDRDYVRVADVANKFESSNTEGFKGDREMSVCELQMEVARAEQDYLAALQELRAARLALQTERKTGVQQFVGPPGPADRAQQPKSRRLTLGRVYCDAMKRIGGTALVLADWLSPNELFAAQDTTRPKQAQDTLRKAAQDSTRRQDSAQAVVPPPVVQAPVPSVVPQDSALTTPQMPPGPVVTPGVAPSTGGGAIPAQAAMESAKLRADQFRDAIYQNEVEIHKKFAISIACVVFVLVGAPIAVRFPRGGVGLVIGFSLVIFAIYYIGLIAGESLADRGIMPPFWAMWAANIILTLVGLVLLARMGRESATSRGGDIRDLLETVRSIFRFGRRREVGTA